jgi:hypothetical protein
VSCHAKQVATPLLAITNGDGDGELAATRCLCENECIYLLDIGEREVSRRRSSRSSADLIYATLASDCLLTRDSTSRSRRNTDETYLAAQRLCGYLFALYVAFLCLM